MKAPDFQKQLFALLLLLAVASCKQTETIVVDRDPEAAAATDTSDTAQSYPEETFRQLTIGENQPVHSLDPLLATNAAEMRAIQMVYEGLVRFNESGEVIPALSEQWTVRDDDRSFTFHLRTNIFYHDSDIFGSGKGRKLTAKDIKFVFERMARNNVPPQAGLMFMNIEGMNAYYQEQRHVYDPKQRQLSSISGITAPNDSTVVFQLNQPDPDFLKKLATPWAVIYPKEAVGTKPNDFKAVGSGPFAFSQQPDDTSYIFSKFSDYYRSSELKINRVDVISSTDETSLWQEMQDKNIYYLPEIGPKLAEQLLTPDGTLKPEVADGRTLSKPVETKLTLHRFFDAEFSSDAGADIAKLAERNIVYLFSGMGPAISNSSFSSSESTLDALSNLRLKAVAPESPYAARLLKNLGNILSKKDASLTITKISVPTREVGLFVTEQWPLLSNSLWHDSSALLSFNLSVYGLSPRGVNGINRNRYPWWIDLRKVQLSDNIN